MTKPILLVTLNSTYQHTAFGLRYIYAQMGSLQPRTEILEYTIKESSRNIVEQLLKKDPLIVGFGIYIWNTLETLEIISLLKRVRPDIIIVLGGPEISYETETQPHVKYADYILTGEADFAFRDLCTKILADQPPEQKIITSPLPEITDLQLPYSYYSDTDIKQRYIYVEASRGCPYKCEYCLSSLDKSVRNFSLDRFLNELSLLIDRGARHFKFVDRTFNLSPTFSTRILDFFIGHLDKDLFLHFEMVPDRLPTEIKERIQKFKPGQVQFEIGLQTLNPAVAQNVSRKNDLKKVAENFDFLKNHTPVHTHADLIVGLPGESIESFAQGFDQLVSWGPDEVQVGLLKRLKGTPIRRHELAYQMIYSEKPPFQIASTSTMNFIELQHMARFAKYWDLYANSGDFKNFMKWLFSEERTHISYFWTFFDFVEKLTSYGPDTHSLSLMTLAERAFEFLKSKNVSEQKASEIIIADYCNGPKKRDIPPFLKSKEFKNQSATFKVIQSNKRQLQHLREH